VHKAARFKPASDGQWHLFAIIAIYSMVVLFALGYVPGAEALLGIEFAGYRVLGATISL